MIHSEQVPDLTEFVKGFPRSQCHIRRLGVALAFLLGTLFLIACDSAPTTSSDSRFGHVGYVRMEVRTSLGGDQGILQESLTWNSNGPWVLAERVSYRGIHGGETLRRSGRNPDELARDYSDLIRELNEGGAFALADGTIPQDLLPACGSQLSQVTYVIRDEPRGETMRWVRCASGPLFSLDPGNAGPDDGAPRVLEASRFTLNFTLGGEASSSYVGTLPYATLERGDHSPAHPDASRLFTSTDGSPPDEFVDFWHRHAGPDAALPTVDWSTESVILAAVGERYEAGEVVQVRRVIPVGSQTRIEVVNEVRGNFCAPAARTGYPFHLIVLPRVSAAADFPEVEVQRVPCGF